MYNYFKFLVLGLILFAFNLVNGQESSGGVPLSFENESTFSKVKSDIQPIILPALDNDAEQLRSDEIALRKCADCGNNYYGRGIDVSIDIKSQGQLRVLKDKSKLWILKLESSTAYGLQFYFDKFKLPEGAKMYVFNEDRSKVLGAFTSNNNPKDDSQFIKFSTEYINGGSIYFEYHEPQSVDFSGKVSIVKIVHLFKDMIPKPNVVEKSGTYGNSGNCNEDVACLLGNGREEEISSVALILGYDEEFDLAAQCSGVLLNNTSGDGTPYFLTAKHCISDTDDQEGNNLMYDYSTWVFLFNHELTECEGANYKNSLSINGSVKLAEDGFGNSYPNSDFLLLELLTTKDVLFSNGICYAGWSRSLDLNFSSSVGVHHPSGDVKKISLASSDVLSTNMNQHYSLPIGNSWRVHWDQGTTEPGSSGSPLFNSFGMVVGQLSRGSAECDGAFSSGYSWYGKFSKAWENETFKNLLDPTLSGVNSIYGLCDESVSDPIVLNCNYGDLQHGFSINGKDDHIVDVCLENDIILAPSDPSHSDCRQFFQPVIETLSFSRLLNSDDCDETRSEGNFFEEHGGVLNCRFKYAKMFISVTLCDGSLNPIGSEFSKWQYFERPVVDSYVDVIYSFNLKDYLPSPHLTMHGGQIYKVKLASVNGSGWREYTKYINIYASDVNVSWVNNPGDLLGGDIRIQNSTINAPIEVVANNTIAILSGANLKAGHYFIDETIGCDSFKSMLVTNTTNSDNNKEELTLSVQESRDNFINSKNKEIKIFPNPTNGEFSVVIESNTEDDIEVDLKNLLGNIILKEVGREKVYKFNLSSYPKGVYLLSVKTGANLSVQKIIYQ